MSDKQTTVDDGIGRHPIIHHAPIPGTAWASATCLKCLRSFHYIMRDREPIPFACKVCSP